MSPSATIVTVRINFDRWLNRNAVCRGDCISSHQEVSHDDFGSSGRKRDFAIVVLLIATASRGYQL